MVWTRRLQGNAENRECPPKTIAIVRGSDPLAGAFLISGARNTFDISNDQRGPARLMACTQALAGFAVKILVEQCQLPPAGILAKTGIVPMTRPPPGSIRQEDRDQPPLNLLRCLLQVHPFSRACGAFDFETLAVEMVIAFECLDQQIIDRKPNGAAPIGITAKQTGV